MINVLLAIKPRKRLLIKQNDYTFCPREEQSKIVHNQHWYVHYNINDTYTRTYKK